LCTVWFIVLHKLYIFTVGGGTNPTCTNRVQSSIKALDSAAIIIVPSGGRPVVHKMMGQL